MIKVVTISSAFAISIALGGCTGMVSGSDGNNGAPGPSGAGNSTGGASASASAGAGGVPVGTGGAGSTPTTPGLDLMHRLNSTEYNATVKDVLGTQLQPAASDWRGGVVAGFDNIAAVLGVDDAQYERYVDAAEAIADDVFASPDLKSKVLTCTTTDDMACVKSIVQQTGLKVFRRPLTDAEVVTYSKLYTTTRAQGQDHAGSVKHVLWSLLVSAQFLFRSEFDEGKVARHDVTGYELASRLSYLLWSSAPDDALLSAAPQLVSDAAITTQVDRMLADTTKSARFVQNFAGQWLGGRQVVGHAVDKDAYPKWTPEIASAAANEIYSYFDEFLRKDLPWSDFLKKDVNFVNAPLAGLYGIGGVSGGSAQRVEFTTDNRGGFLSLLGFMAISSVADRSSPTMRGKWMLSFLLCSPPNPPPANVPALGGADPASTAKKNVREVLEAHRAAPGCRACHSVLDPLGLALEQYDGIGQFRATYPDGTAIDATAELPPSSAFPSGVKFAGLDGAVQTITSDPRFQTCITEKLYTFGLGRELSTEDKVNAASITKSWQTAGSLSIKQLLRSLGTSAAFRSRTPSTP